ncbi:MAG: hypothetical protein CV087_19820 [Candidatus Brocadia sp. WS118]|nr:MAG: hypothetical protein CV087_19820 [Candidatus Brocadia sp. WS118]
MDRATFLDLMDKYIDGIMSDAEKYEFDLMLTNDPSLRQEFNTHKTLRKGIKLSGRNDLINELNSIKKDVSISNSGNIKKISSGWYIAFAAVLVSVIAVLFLFNNKNETSPISKYAGIFNMQVLPIEGKLGGGVATESVKVILKSNNRNEYELIKDTLIIYSKPEIIETILLMDPFITLNQDRKILIETKNQKYIFTKKNN